MNKRQHKIIKFEIMQANELRIGNWVLMQNTMEDYYPMPIEDGCQISGGDKYEPIPLTPEILEKCGFESDAWDEMPDETTSYTLPVFDDRGDYYASAVLRSKYPFTSVIVDAQEYKVSRQYNYLHQLQNLYFALTGQELEVNLKSMDEIILSLVIPDGIFQVSEDGKTWQDIEINRDYCFSILPKAKKPRKRK
jgi:hypothetical protein